MYWPGVSVGESWDQARPMLIGYLSRAAFNQALSFILCPSLQRGTWTPQQTPCLRTGSSSAGFRRRYDAIDALCTVPYQCILTGRGCRCMSRLRSH